MNETTIRLLYLDDHPVMIRGLRDIFRANRDTICVTLSAENAVEAIASADPDKFDLIILDLFLGDADPLVNITLLKNHFVNKPIIIYSGHTGIGLMKEAFRLGVRGWIVKTSEKAEIKDIIQRVFHHATIYPQEMLRYQTLEAPQNTPAEPTYKPFNPDKEQQAILKFLCEGCTTADIAKQLRVTLSTVEKRLQLMREVAEVKTNYELVVLYMRTFGLNH